jgi:hypothetical protein
LVDGVGYMHMRERVNMKKAWGSQLHKSEKQKQNNGRKKKHGVK